MNNYFATFSKVTLTRQLNEMNFLLLLRLGNQALKKRSIENGKRVTLTLNEFAKVIKFNEFIHHASIHSKRNYEEESRTLENRRKSRL